MTQMDLTVLDQFTITGRGVVFYVQYDWKKVDLRLGMKVVNERGEVGIMTGASSYCGMPPIPKGKRGILVRGIAEAKGFNIVADEADE